MTAPETTPVAPPALPSVTRPLKVASIAEGTTWLVLIACVIAKYVFDAPGEGGVPIMGPVHGVVFLAYALLVLIGRGEQRWDVIETIKALVLSLVPGGGYWVHRRMIADPAPGRVDP